MKYTIVASCLLVSAYAQAVRPDVCDGDAKARERTTPPQVRVMTYNVRYSAGDRKSKDNNWKARRGDFARVVEREDEKLLKTVTWVLQPQKSSDRLRVFLFENGFDIVDENASEDRGLYYLIIKAVYTGVPSKYTLAQKYYGPVILRRIEAEEPVVLSYKERLDRRFEMSSRGEPEVKQMLEEISDGKN